MPRRSLRWLALAFLVLVSAAAGEVRPADPPASEVLTGLFRHISPDDFDYDAGERLTRLEEALDGLQAARTGEASACPRYCDERSRILETSCSELLQPSAARARAVCLARVNDMTAQCRAGCGR